MLIPPEDLRPKGDLNDWLRVGAKGDPASFRSILEQSLAASPTQASWVASLASARYQGLYDPPLARLRVAFNPGAKGIMPRRFQDVKEAGPML